MFSDEILKDEQLSGHTFDSLSKTDKPVNSGRQACKGCVGGGGRVEHPGTDKQKVRKTCTPVHRGSWSCIRRAILVLYGGTLLLSWGTHCSGTV